MNKSEEIIFIIDDEESVRESLSLLLISNDYSVESFSSSEEYLNREAYHGTGCIVLDLKLRGKSGLDLQEKLTGTESILPIIFISGRGNIPVTVQALKKGAVNFLEKPLRKDELLKSINEALSLSKDLKSEKEETAKACRLINTLTDRELEILKYIMSGMLNKQIASCLSISEETVKVHKHNIHIKLGVKSVPELIRIAGQAGVIPSEKKD
jgi:two-component system, LuxR family, response regulator FixJ